MKKIDCIQIGKGKILMEDLKGGGNQFIIMSLMKMKIQVTMKFKTIPELNADHKKAKSLLGISLTKT